VRKRTGTTGDVRARVFGSAGLFIGGVASMPTEAKRQIVADLAGQIRRCTMAIATDYTNLPVNEMTELRRQMRERDVEYRVVKNRLAKLAAIEAGSPGFVELLEGSSGIAFGYGEPLEVAKTLNEFIKATRSRLVIRSALMEGEVVSAAQVIVLANLPSKNELVAKLMGQLQSPIAGLMNVLNGPIRGLSIVLQRRAEQLGVAG
jgi:large subunit ribosomal protein L10